MKISTTKTLYLTGILIFSLSCFGQESDGNSKSKDIKPIKQDQSQSNPIELKTVRKNEPQTISIGQRRQVLTKEDKIEALENHIEAIDTKVEYINSDQNLRKKAIKDNWYEQMRTIRKELVIELNSLQSE